MTDRQETIADIIAWLRKPREGENAYLTLWRDEIADRLEAAWKRERELTKPAEIVNSGAASDSGGNCAKLREALVKCREIALQWQADEAAGVAGTTDKPHARSAAEAVVDMEFEINAALAAPPRNCDKFGGDYKMLHTAWFDWTGSPSGQNPDGTAKLTFAKWLLAPATETEGETDGSK